MKKILVLPISLVLLAAIGATVTAESVTDPTGDVYHWKYTDTTWGWDTNIGDKPNIDITDLTYTINGDQVTLSMNVAGTIASSEGISYTIWLNTTDSYYTAGWTNGEGYGMGVSTEEGSYEMDFEPEISVSGNTITVTFDTVGTFTGIDAFWGFSQEFYDSSEGMAGEYWADWAPESYSWYEGDDTNGDDTDGDTSGETDDSGDTGETSDDGTNTNTPPPSGTPGFELIALITAFAAIVFILKKRV
ncbi:MAG: hypothetical protein R6U21_01190 [Thermoplasmatota archaeon]